VGFRRLLRFDGSVWTGAVSARVVLVVSRYSRRQLRVQVEDVFDGGAVGRRQRQQEQQQERRRAKQGVLKIEISDQD
jgi:hypothetical protein